MANTSQPYRRVGANSWEELINKVNDVLENPDDGCDPIEPLEVPEAPHRWAKSDIREVHDRLNEMPGDCFEFDPIPDLWKKSIIDNIEEQLENAWCECEGCEPCQVESLDWETIHTHSWSYELCGFNPSGPNCGETVADWVGIQYYHDLTLEEIAYYESAAVDMCFLNLELVDLEEDLADAEAELAAAESARDAACAADPPTGCAAAQVIVDEKQQIVDDLEDDIEAKEAEIEAARTARDDASSAADAAAVAGWTVLSEMEFDRSPTSTVVGQDYENITEKLLAKIGTLPWAKDDTCRTKFLFPWRCRGGWQFRQENKCFGTSCSCTLRSPNYFTFTYSYTPNGIPVPTEQALSLLASAWYWRCNYYLDPVAAGCDSPPAPPSGCPGIDWDARVRFPSCPEGTEPPEEPPTPGDPLDLTPDP